MFIIIDIMLKFECYFVSPESGRVALALVHIVVYIVIIFLNCIMMIHCSMG